MEQNNSPQKDGPNTEGAKLVWALFQRHGLERRRWSVVVGEVLKLSRSASHHRVFGESSWSVDDLEALFKHFGESLNDRSSHSFVPATLVIDHVRTAVLVRLDEEPPEQSDFWVAFGGPQGITVVPRGQVGSGVQTLRVRGLSHEERPAKGMKIAVLDDSYETTESIVQALRHRGFYTRGYTQANKLIDDLSAGYEAFVIDWQLAGENAAERVLARIRAQTHQSRIVLLTGEISDGGSATSSEVAERLPFPTATATSLLAFSTTPICQKLKLATLR